MKLLILITLLFTINSWGACENKLPLSEVVKAVALEANAGSKSCEMLPDEQCLCFDDIQWGGAELVDDEEVEGQKKLVMNATKLAAYNTAQAQKAQLANAMAQATKAQDCGRSTKAYMLVRNAPKNLSSTQVKQLVATTAAISGLLDSGSLVSAQEEIAAVQADGVIVTEADKTALIAHINGCKP